MFAITLAMAPVVHGQIQPGNLFGQVLDQQGMPLPGVTLTLEGQGAPQVQVSNAQGEFRFVGIPPSTNHLKAETRRFRHGRLSQHPDSSWSEHHDRHYDGRGA